VQGFKRILVALGADRTSSGALERARALAMENQAHITLALVEADVPALSRMFLPARIAEWEKIVMKENAARLEERAASLRSDNIEVSTRVLKGSEPIELIRLVLRENQDLVLKDFPANNEGGLAGGDLRLLRKCPCPVWMVKSDGKETIKRILAAVDPQPGDVERNALNIRLVELAVALAQAHAAELHVVHAWSVAGASTLDRWLSPEEADRYVDTVRDGVGKVFDELIRDVPGAAALARTHMVHGTPETAIPHMVQEEGIDLVVMGTVARTGVPGLLIGNTAEKVLPRISCSILAVKPEHFVSPVTVD